MCLQLSLRSQGFLAAGAFIQKGSQQGVDSVATVPPNPRHLFGGEPAQCPAEGEQGGGGRLRRCPQQLGTQGGIQVGQGGAVAGQEGLRGVCVGREAAAELWPTRLALGSWVATQRKLRGKEHVEDGLTKRPVEIVGHTPEKHIRKHLA